MHLQGTNTKPRTKTRIRDPSALGEDDFSSMPFLSSSAGSLVRRVLVGNLSLEGVVFEIVIPCWRKRFTDEFDERGSPATLFLPLFENLISDSIRFCQKENENAIHRRTRGRSEWRHFRRLTEKRSRLQTLPTVPPVFRRQLFFRRSSPRRDR